MFSAKPKVGKQAPRAGHLVTRVAARLPAAILLLGTLIFLVNIWRNRLFLHDDAFISLKYARNLLEHGELSWNVGERVEGYTNFLYILITSGIMKIGVDPVLALRIINALAVVLLVGAVVFGARALLPERRDMQALAVALVLGNVSISLWLYGGLEAPLSAAFIAWAVAFLMVPTATDASTGSVRFLVFSGCAFALAVLTRPDAVVAVASASFGVLITAKGPVTRRMTRAAIVAGIPLVAFLIHMAWRYSYYGDVVPNTFHAKVGLSFAQRTGRVAEYFLMSAVLYLPVLGCAAVSALAAFVWGKWSRPATVLLTVCVGFCAYIVWSGGDHMAAARVLLPISGPAALLVVAAIGSLDASKSVVACVAIMGLLLLASLNARSFRMDWAAFNGTVIGRYIEDAWPAGSLVALNTAGSTPFYGASHRYIDMLGLNDRTIALRENVPVLARRQAMPGHGKGDGAYVLGREPDFIILGGAEGIDVTDASKWFLTGVELGQSSEFLRCYAKEVVPVEVPQEFRRFQSSDESLTFTFYRRICPRSGA